ncbi:unnamed protein product [marine sediment metagenome]|uniref:DUF4386 domain-containing protein n=1 Tax=marine sediment metagenome TaxID=412755 RepID=X0ULD5_9ZZZZ
MNKIKTILLVLNSILVAILSLGAGYFVFTPFIIGYEISLEQMLAGLTQNYAMRGLWVFYLISVVFLILSKKYNHKLLFIVNSVYLGLFIFFVVLITSSSLLYDIMRLFDTQL